MRGRSTLAPLRQTLAPPHRTASADQGPILNRCYRLKWNHVLAMFVPAPELARAQGKGAGRGARSGRVRAGLALAATAAALMTASTSYASDVITLLDLEDSPSQPYTQYTFNF